MGANCSRCCQTEEESKLEAKFNGGKDRPKRTVSEAQIRESLTSIRQDPK